MSSKRDQQARWKPYRFQWLGLCLGALWCFAASPVGAATRLITVQGTTSDDTIAVEVNGAPVTLIPGTPLASFSGSALLTEGANTLTVTAHDRAGNMTTSSVHAFLDTIAPTLTGIASSALTASSATITWTSDEPADSQLEYGPTSSYGTATPLDPTLVMSHRIDLSGLSANTLYHYRVASQDAAGNRTTSGDFTLTTLVPPDTTPPTAPTGVLVTPVDSTTLQVAWSPSTDNVAVTGYRLDASTSNTFNSFVAGYNNRDVGSVTSVSLSGLSPSTTYYVRVRASDAAGNVSANSSPASGTTLLAPSFDFSLSSGGTVVTTQGSSSTTSVTASLVSGSPQAVSFSASGLPSGATATFSPTSCTPQCTSTLTISTLSTTPTGNTTITLTATSGTMTHTASMTLTVNPQTATGQTFYVSLAGSDANPGTAGQPFRTIEKGIRSVRGPGDEVIIKPGTYRPISNSCGFSEVDEVMAENPGVSGTAANPIRIHAETPGTVIWSEHAILPGTWTLVSGNIWKFDYSSYSIAFPCRDVNQVAQDGTLLFPVIALTHLTQPGQWYRDSTAKTLYVWTTDGGSPNAHTMSFSRGITNLRIHDNSYWEISGIQFHGASGGGITNFSQNGPCNFITITNNTFSFVGDHSIGGDSTNGSDIRLGNRVGGGWVISGNTFLPSTSEFIHYAIFSAYLSENTPPMVIEHNLFDGRGQDTMYAREDHPSGNQSNFLDKAPCMILSTPNTIVRYNEFKNCTDWVDRVEDPTPVGVTAPPTGQLWIGNLLHDSVGGITFDAHEGTGIQGNIFLNNFFWNNRSGGGYADIRLNGATSRNLFYENTIYKGTGTSGGDTILLNIGQGGVGPPTNNVFKNNIIVNTTLTSQDLLWVAPGGTGNVFDNNMWWRTNQTSGPLFTYLGNTYTTFAAFQQAVSQEPNGLFTDPLLVDPMNGNLHLKQGSPAIDRVVSANVPTMPEAGLDIDSDPRPQGSAWDIGADEVVVGGAIYYLGPFTNATPSDTPSCGTRTNPCASLAYWNQFRRATALASGGTVRFAPGTYLAQSITPYHCIIAQKDTTYEGRAADDTPLNNYSTVIIDASNTDPNRFNTPCRAWSIVPLGHGGNYPDTKVADISNFTLRNMTVANAPLSALEFREGSALYGAPGTTNILVDHVRVTGNKSGGLVLGQHNWRQFQCNVDGSWCPLASSTQACNSGGTCTLALDYDCQFTHRDTKNVTVVDSEFDHNAQDPNSGASGGLIMGCVDGFAIARVKSHDNHAAGVDCYQHNPPGCDGVDGFDFQGAIHGTVTDIEANDNGEGDIDFGITSEFNSHDIIVDRAYWHSQSPSGIDRRSGLKTTAGWNITIRNSYGIGDYLYNIEHYNCSNRIKFYNNTIWETGTTGYALSVQNPGTSNCYLCEFINNIFHNNWSGTSAVAAFNSFFTNSSVKWQNNVVVNENPNGMALWNKSADTSTPTDYRCQTAIDHGLIPPLVSTPVVGTNPLPQTAAGLSSFQTNAWFGPGTGLGDKWGVLPSFVNRLVPTPANLHLAPTDTVAKDAGQALSSFVADYDGNPRPQGASWDIGADEVR